MNGAEPNWSLQKKAIFVSKSGNDANKGLSVNEAFATINRAIVEAAPGDTIYILKGIYSESISFKNVNGLPEKAVCISGYSEKADDYPVIDGLVTVPSLDASSQWITIENSSWIEISKIRFINGWTLPVKLVNSSYISFKNCDFKGAKRVISASGLSTHHILVENCSWDQGGDFLWHVKQDNKGVDAWTSMHHGDMAYFNGSLIDFNGTGGSVVIRNNKIVNAFNAIRYRGEKGCDSNVEIYNNDISNIRDNDFEPEYYTFNVHIYHNRSHNIHRTLSVDNVEGGNIFYYGNVITTDNNDWSRLICSGFWKVYGTGRLLSFPVYAFNNSFYGAGRCFSAGNKSRTSDFIHYNNAYYFTVEDGWVLKNPGTKYEFDYDISNSPWPDNIIQNGHEKNGKIADVKFTDPAAGDLRLMPGSPCIDAGRVMNFREFDWTQSYSGKAPDVGAFENGKLAEGPPFRFIAPTDGKIEYREKPRITRAKVVNDKLQIFFSAPVDPSSTGRNQIKIYCNNKEIGISKTYFAANNYELVINADSNLDENSLSLSFTELPVGLNGEKATYWASAVKIHN